MKKLLKASLLVLITLGLLVGCGNDEKDGENQNEQQNVVEQDHSAALLEYVSSNGITLEDVQNFDQNGIVGIVGTGVDQEGEEGFIAIAEFEIEDIVISLAFETAEEAINSIVE